MRSTIFIIAMLISSSVYGQQEHKAKEGSQTKPKKPSDVSELIFNRMDSNKDGSISLKEFKTAFPRFRQSSSRGSGRPSSSSGRTRGFDGKTPSFKPEGNTRSRGRPSRGYRGSSRGRR